MPNGCGLPWHRLRHRRRGADDEVSGDGTERTRTVALRGSDEPDSDRSGIVGRAEGTLRRASGTVYRGGRPGQLPFALGRLQFLGRDHDHGNVLGGRVGAQGIQHCEPIHLRHHQVEHHQVGPLLADEGQPLAPVHGLVNLVVALGLEYPADEPGRRRPDRDLRAGELR